MIQRDQTTSKFRFKTLTKYLRIIDITEFGKGFTSGIRVAKGRGKIGKRDLTDCHVRFYQDSNNPLHVHIFRQIPKCKFDSCGAFRNHYFGKFSFSYGCLRNLHPCAQNYDSTTQLWFGTLKVNTAQARVGNAESVIGSAEASENTDW